MTEQRSPTLSEIDRQCDIIIDNLYNGTAQKAAYLKKETPEEYAARKELQAQRKVKKETPEEHASRIEYMKRKEKVELEAEAQRLFNKEEKKHQNHLAYLGRQSERELRELAREEMREKNEAYKKTPEGRLEQIRIDERKAYKDEKTRNWNTPEEIRKRRDNEEEWQRHQKEHLDSYIARCKHQYENKDKIRETYFNTGKWEDKVDRNYKHAMSLR